MAKVVRRNLTARISPLISLNEICIRLDHLRPPTVELRGTVQTGNRQVDVVSSAMVRTIALTPEVEAAIESLKQVFGGVED